MRWRFALVLAAALCVLVVYAAVLYEMPKGVFLSPDEGAKFLMLHSMEWTREGLTYHIPYGGQQMDPEDRFYPNLGGTVPTFPYPLLTADGTVLFHWQIWFPLLCRVLHDHFGLIGIYLVPLVSGWLIAVVSGWLTGRLRPGLAPLGILLVGLGTPVFFYSVSFWEHTAASLLGLLAVALCVVRPAALSYLIACVLVLAGALFRIELIVLGWSLLLAGVASALVNGSPVPGTGTAPAHLRSGRSRWISVSLIVLAVALASQFYDHLPLRLHTFIEWIPRHFARLPQMLPYLPQGLASVLVSTATNQGPAVDPFWTRAALCAVGVCMIAPLLRRSSLEGTLLLFGLSATLAFSVLLLVSNQKYRSLHGVFPIAPFAVLAPYALATAWRATDPMLLRLSMVALAYLAFGVGALFVMFVRPPGDMMTGLEWGQRYLLTLYPLTAILALVVAADYWRSSRPRVLRCAALLLMSVAMTIGVHFEVRGLAMLRSNLQVFSAWDEALRTDGPVVTDVWWLPTALAHLFVTREVYYIHRGHIEEWVDFAMARGVRRFVFAGLGAVHDDQFGSAAAYRRGALRRLREMTLATFEIPGRTATSSQHGDASIEP